MSVETPNWMRPVRWLKVWEGCLAILRGGGGVIHKIQISSPVGSILAEGRNGPQGEWTDPIGWCVCDG